MVVVAQLVRVAVCGAAGRRFEPGQPPRFKALKKFKAFFVRLYFFEIIIKISNIARGFNHGDNRDMRCVMLHSRG